MKAKTFLVVLAVLVVFGMVMGIRKQRELNMRKTEATEAERDQWREAALLWKGMALTNEVLVTRAIAVSAEAQGMCRRMIDIVSEMKGMKESQPEPVMCVTNWGGVYYPKGN